MVVARTVASGSALSSKSVACPLAPWTGRHERLNGVCSFRIASFQSRREAPVTCQLNEEIQPEEKSWIEHFISNRFLASPFAVITFASIASSLGLGDGLDASDPFSVATALGILTVVVAVHECGHFLAARLQNIHVSKFAIGFGPSLLQYQGKEVQYSVRALPLGGFVAFPDDDPDCPYPDDDPDLLRNRPIVDRALVISAGVIANIIFAFVILFAQATTVGITTEILEPGVIVPKVLKGSVADKAGITAGDVIISVDGMAAAPSPSSVDLIVEEIESHPNREMSFIIDRQGAQVTLTATPSAGPDGHGRLGMQLLNKRHLSNHIALDVADGAQLATDEFLRLNGEILHGLHQLIFNFSKSAEQVSGPIAMVAMGAEVARLNTPQLYLFAAAINLNLAIVNTLPLPALDGGYFALLMLEAIRGGKKLPQRLEQGVMASGILFLMALGCLLLVRDTVHLALPE